ncbi:MAG: sialidase family protein [Jatrophihabitans sp.]|uniref:sialidase family protein n=1 Tax=Jatrophihabitans sp. TaxID=1932789 RepID=UPI00390EC0F0
MVSARIRRRAVALTALPLLVAGLATAPRADAAVGDNVNVTGNHAYTRVDGGTDPVIARCGSDNRPQNETSLAVDPLNGQQLAAGANDYCTTPVAGDAWEGLYTSSDGGHSWTLSLIPGYPGDTSPQGLSSPLHGLVGATGDPWDAFDRHGRLYAMGNAFNRAHPQNASVWVASYQRDATAPIGYQYRRTVIVASGTAGNGQFNDKVALTVDNQSARYDGTVYAAWSQFHGSGNNEIDVAVSHDHGATFSKPVKVSAGSGDNQFPDLAVAADGTAYLVWREFAGRNNKDDAIAYSTSGDGGATWAPARPLTTFVPYDKSDAPSTAAAAAAARAAGGPDYVDEEDAGGSARDCGDPPSACQSGYTFYRDDSQPRIAADANGVYVVYNELINPHDTNTTYAPGGVSQVHLWQRGTGSWNDRGLVDPAAGHQTFPTVAADGSSIFVGWVDSRVDPCFSQERPAGNCADGSAPVGGSLTSWATRLPDGGGSGQSGQVATAKWNPNWEQFSGRTVPFYGDYDTVASGGGSTYFDWTDNRDVAGYTGPNTEGNDVLGDPHVGGECSVYASTCFDLTRGLDQNEYVAQLG